MTKDKYFVIGVMSGTSLDGLDLVYVSIDASDWNFEILESLTLPYTNKWFDALKTSVNLDLDAIKDLDKKYTVYLAEALNQFIKKHTITELDFISSHGHTVLHQPENGLTYQIGNLSNLSSMTGQKVICDFRVQDVKLCGQGAPLVPIGDRLLFGDYSYCLNLGGFANISFENNNKRIAYDICPANIVLNHYCESINLKYDDKGKMASQGFIHSDLLKDLNSLNFYTLKHPKSLGLEWVKAEIFPLIASYDISITDILRTFIEHIAVQITSELKSDKSLLITGGGAFNDFLISRIEALSSCDIVIPSDAIVNYKEALIFALLGVLKDRGEINCLSSVTGAPHNHSSGRIFIP